MAKYHLYQLFHLWVITFGLLFLAICETIKIYINSRISNLSFSCSSFIFNTDLIGDCSDVKWRALSLLLILSKELEIQGFREGLRYVRDQEIEGLTRPL